MQVWQILKSKGHKVTTIGPHARVAEALRTLWMEEIGALVVTDENRKFLGIISERDIIRGLAAHGIAFLDEEVGERMDRQAVTCTPETAIDELMHQMTKRRIRHLPVLRGGELVGIVSMGDVVKNRLDELEHETHALRGYLHSIR